MWGTKVESRDLAKTHEKQDYFQYLQFSWLAARTSWSKYEYLEHKISIQHEYMNWAYLQNQFSPCTLVDPIFLYLTDAKVYLIILATL